MIDPGEVVGRDEPALKAAGRPAPRKRLPGVNLRPGSVKQARQEAGLSLARVAKGHVTAPAIYLIETGRTRPSLPTLEHIARRTGKPIEFFLAEPSGPADQTQSGLVELEATLAEGRFSDAIELGRRLLVLGSSAYRRARIRFFLAQAHLELGQPELAGPLLREAQAHFESVDDRLMLAECLGSDAMLTYMSQMRGGQALAERALAICRALQPAHPVTEARLLTILATVHVANKDWQPAIQIYQEAVEAAGSVFDLRQLAKMYNGLSFAYRQAGQVEAATGFATRAIALYEVLRDQVKLAWAENSLGMILLAKGDRAAAHKHLDRSLELSEGAHLEVGRSHVMMSLCELSMQEGNLQSARQFAQQALRLSERLQELPNIAEAHVWLGRVAAELGEHEVVDAEFELGLRGLAETGVEERLLRCHGIYAEILEKRGELQKAYVHMKKALAASRPGLLQEATSSPAEDAGSD